MIPLIEMTLNKMILTKSKNIKITLIKITHNKMTLIKTALIKRTLIKMTLIKMTPQKMTLIKTTPEKMTLIKMTLCEMPVIQKSLCIMPLFKITLLNSTHRNDTPPEPIDPNDILLNAIQQCATLHYVTNLTLTTELHHLQDLYHNTYYGRNLRLP
jgi:hypothetical protein